MSRKIHDHYQTSHHQVFSMWTAYSSYSPLHWVRNHRPLWPHRKFRYHGCILESTHTHCWPFSTAKWQKIIIRRRQWNNQWQPIYLPLLRQCTCIWTLQQNTQNLAQKPDVNKKYANFIPFVNQQEEDRLSNQLTSVTTGYINAMIDSILHD